MSDTQSLPPTKAMIGKWSVDRYVALIRRWAIGSALLTALVTLAALNRALVVMLEILTVVIIGWIVARRGGGKVESLTSGAFVGIILGLASSVSRFILHPTVTSASMIVVETVLSTIIATLVAMSAGLITILIYQQKN